MTLPTRSYKPWVMVPADGLLEAMQTMTWQKLEGGSAGAGTAALMIYVVLLFVQTEQPRTVNIMGIETPYIEHVADVTYDDLAHITGLSRSLIRQGLDRLQTAKLIKSSGSRQKRIYVLKWPPGRWFKLPCRAIMSSDGIAAFKSFTLRSKHELNALKLFLYLADVRDRFKQYAEASYETIFKRTGISERDIRRAINVLNASGLLARVHRDSDRNVSSWGPNLYYLKGYGDLSQPENKQP